MQFDFNSVGVTMTLTTIVIAVFGTAFVFGREIVDFASVAIIRSVTWTLIAAAAITTSVLVTIAMGGLNG